MPACPDCGAFVGDLRKHRRRGRCHEQHKRGGPYNIYGGHSKSGTHHDTYKKKWYKKGVK